MADKRYTGKEEEKQKKSKLMTLAKTTAVVGGGAAAYRYRGQIKNIAGEARAIATFATSRVLNQKGMANHLNKETRLLMGSIIDSLGEKPSLRRTLRGSYDPNVQDKMRRDFENSFRNRLEKRQNASNKPGKNKTKNVQKVYKGFHKREVNGLTKHQHAATHAFRENEINKMLGGNELIRKKGGDSIMQALSDFNRHNERIYDDPLNHTKTFVEKLEKGDYKQKVSFKNKKERNSFISTIEETISEFSNTRKTYEKHKETIDKMANALETGEAFSFIEQMLKDKSRLSDPLGRKGFRPVTLKDTERMTEAQKRQYGIIIDDVDKSKNPISIDMSKEMKAFLEKHKNNQQLHQLMQKEGVQFDFSYMVLDLDLRINHLGEVIDNRHIREGIYSAIDTFQDNFRVPFLNINPLDLTPWKTFRSGMRKEGLELLRTGQVQGYVRNIGAETFDGSARAEQTGAIRGGMRNANHFYVNGSVFKFDHDGGLARIDKDLYMVSSQFGPFSRMHKNQTGYTNNTEADTRGFLTKLFDLRYQEGESRAETYMKAWNKLSDEKYGPNAMSSLLHRLHTTDENQMDAIREVYGILRVGVERSATNMSREAIEVIAPKANEALKYVKVNGKAFDINRLANDDYLIDASLSLFREFEAKGAEARTYKEHVRSVYNQNGTKRTSSKLYEDSSVTQLKKIVEQYVKDPEGFLSDYSVAPTTKLPGMFDFVTGFLGEDDQLVPATDKLRRAFHQYALRAIDYAEADLHGSVVTKGVRKRSSIQYLEEAGKLNIISEDDLKNAKDLEVLTDLLSYDGIYNKKYQASEAKTFLEDIMNIPEGQSFTDGQRLIFEDGPATFTDFGQALQESILRAQPIKGRAPEPRKSPANGADFMLMRKSGIMNTVKENLGNINYNIMKEGPIDDGWDVLINAELIARRTAPKLWDTAVDVTKELFAGRHRRGDNLEDVTTTTAIIYGLAERMDNQFTNLGLGLSSKNMGSFQSIIGNQFMRRIALPYMAYQQAVYFDGLTGDTISDTAADAYVTSHIALQKTKEVLGINKAMRPWANVLKEAGGADQVGEWMGVKQLDFLTMGVLSDFRSGEETEYYYEHGEDAVRKNRYWGIGSPSPWAGGGISHFEPNWYRKVKSDYKFTDTMYGSEKEYWANHWMPTLTNPLAPIRHFITDPYHYEKKHEADRPYAVTGGFSEIQQIPLIGNLIDGTVGRILKPRKEHKGLEKAHEEYLGAINEYIQEQYSPAHDGTFITVSGTGAVESFNAYAQQGTDHIFGGAAPVYGANVGKVNRGNGIVPDYSVYGEPTPQDRFNILGGLEISIPTLSGGVGGSGPSSGPGFGIGGEGFGGYRGYSAESARLLLAEANYHLAEAGDGTEATTTSGLLKLQNKALEQDVANMERLDSLKGMFLDGFYSASELSGIYGFLTKTGMGYEESWRGTTLAPSTLMTSYSRAFWDNNLGGAGGSLSEIGRRYVPRDPNKDYYSPIRNLMPYWLPGIESSTDFLHGDAYSKIQKGEMRLPGAAYESLYQLHPDGTGTGEYANYGVFDRFRILADIDPDSAQYKSAKHQVSLLRQAGGMTEAMEKEYDGIIEQVKAKEDTIRWYDKKYTNAKIKKKTVTISKVIDANTFMVREYDSPIKLAGIELTEKDNQDIINWMSQYIKVGEKVQIGIAEEAAARHNNDTYNTMSAVVYTQKNEEGRFWFESNKGQSLNAIIANRWHDDVKIKDTGKAVDTRALYSNDMVAFGKGLEWLTHDVFPKVPFLGIFADKFLQVRTPVESYIRDQVYSTDWRPWQQPYEGWIKPMVNTIASQNPLIAGGEMAAIGHMFAKTEKGRGLGRILGFAVGATLSSARVYKEGIEDFIPGTDGLWLPKERRKEREINEYFDRLKYVKYRGLYEQAARLARQKEGVDVDEFFMAVDEKARKNKSLKRYLENKKKQLSFSKKIGYVDSDSISDELDDLNNGLEQISDAKEVFVAGKYTSLAIRYRKEYEGTLYALGQTGGGDRTALMRALTPKEREYIPRFMEETSSSERQKILKYVPQDIKRILQSQWGMKVDKQEDISSYFNDHYLPDTNWEGWAAAVNLDDIKIKVMKKEGINPTVSGYWGKDQARAEQSGVKAIPLHSLSSKLDVTRLAEVIRGAGLSDVDVQLTTSYAEGPGGIRTNINIMQDLTSEILDVMNEGIHNLF